MNKRSRKGSNRRPSPHYLLINGHRNEFKMFIDQPVSAATFNFEYTFVLTGVSIKRVIINDTIVFSTKLVDKVYAEKNKPFYIQILASRTLPNGSATFQLKDLVKNKNVFSEPQELTFANGGNGGIFLENVALP